MKKIILTADDLGIDTETNLAIKAGYTTGMLTSTCLLANGEAFNDAIDILNKCEDLELGIHLNIIEGKALTINSESKLTDKNGNFDNSYIDILLQSVDKRYLALVEKEFRAQIEKILDTGKKPVYINTHVHTHSIPNIFKLVCKLADEYGIKKIRTQAEIPYYTKGIHRHLGIRYCLNIIKNILLNSFTFLNKFTANKYGIITNTYFLGVLYTGQMDEYTMMSGINKLPETSVAEIIIHPSVNENCPRHYKEYKAIISDELKTYFEKDNIEAIQWGNINE